MFADEPHTNLSRRQALRRCSATFGGLVFSTLGLGPSLARATTHHPARARSVIFLYMAGGPSQVDTFDPKPRLQREHGQVFRERAEPTQFNNNGTILASPWRFRAHGRSGIPVSSLFPHVAGCVDDLAVVRSMVSDFSEHATATCFLHVGHRSRGRPSVGAWVAHALADKRGELPPFIVINGGSLVPGGNDNFAAGFLPATCQASIFRPTDPPLANVRSREKRTELQEGKLDLVHRLDRLALQRLGHEDSFRSAVACQELAERMQVSIPRVANLAGESRATQLLYGLDADHGPTRTFARQCLIARRLVQRGVPFVELTCPLDDPKGWDQHRNLRRGHEKAARSVDQPIAALLTDLRALGLLESTLVVWAGEFGRTPFAEGTNGRDHNPFGFTVWLAGGGIKGGTIHGATDEYGYRAVQDRVDIHDLHATILHLLGIDHQRLTFRAGGRDMRLTDVHGQVIEAVLA